MGCLAPGPAMALHSVRRSRTLRTTRDHVVADTRARMTDSGCPFCSPPVDRVFHHGRLVVGLWDQFPVSQGHALIIPRRHVASWFEATDEERVELMAAVTYARAAIEHIHQPDGYNLGVNVGHAAGQTIFHLHVHVIPRYHRDVPSPRGGVRYVIPEKADYVGQVREAHAEGYTVFPATTPGRLSGTALIHPPHGQALVRGGDDPLLPHLRAHLTSAVRVDIAVAFVLQRGLSVIDEHLKDVVRRGGHLRILTGDYLDVTEPNALRRLLDLAALAAPATGTVELRVFETMGDSFHPKSYILHLSDGDSVAFVGSSNLSELALGRGIEWNYRVVPARDRAGFGTVVAAFETLFRHPNTRALDAAWVGRYAARRATELTRTVELVPEPLPPPPEPHEVQREALAALERTRVDGNAAGLVVMATGLGKTWLAAFDTDRPEYQRVLFVAHREEILAQALTTFRRIRPTAVLGLYTGDEKVPEADVLFASIQTLGRARHLGQFSPDTFDYIVVDEFHHAAAATYRRLIDHFEPRFLLGLTATPERTDGGDLLGLCGENLVYRCDLWDGVRRGLLAPFHYFGVPDEVDYRNIPWRSARFNEEALTRAVATQSRAQNALEQYRQRAGARTLAFCCSTRHADFMADFFTAAGLRAVAVHSDGTSAPRAASLERLQVGTLDVIFAVDMFNEGVDLPALDTIMMLRPTESRIVWMQQFGRGLRKVEHKDHLTVIDYIGNHRIFLLKPEVLLGLEASTSAVAAALTKVETHTLELPPGCEVTYELRAVEILRALLPRPTPNVFRAWYEDFRERHGIRPRAIEAFHENYSPRLVRRTYDSWLLFVNQMGDLSEPQASLVRGAVPGFSAVAPRVHEFLEELETTPMTRSYKMIVLLAMLNEDCLPGTVTIDALARTVNQLARRSARLQEDFGTALEDFEALAHHLEVNPIAAWSGGAGTSGVKYFTYEASRFASRFDVPAAQREAFQELVRELVDWRLAEYLQRQPATDDAIVCKVSHTGGRPILFLPDRAGRPDIPEGTTPVLIDGQRYEADFAKIAVNVIRAHGSARNNMAGLLRSWFGPDAGLPGTSFLVRFERTADEEYRLVPLGPRTSSSQGPEEWRQYSREAIPPLFSLEYNAPVWNQGFIFKDNRVVLLVTLDKSTQAKEHRYEDRFEAADRFQWQSQNKQHRGGTTEQKLSRHVELGIPVHLFVRKTSKIDGRAAPFLYCGECEFLSWEGDRPITVRWKLKSPVPDRWRGVFDVPNSPPIEP
jgi:superfamily II DNA or RNA helicase/HKD family nuclease/diadenosine tetraphosphate (Ap4A) HIT family hydrolase